MTKQLFGQDVKDGILGNFKINANGDTTLGTGQRLAGQGPEGRVPEDDHAAS